MLYFKIMIRNLRRGGIYSAVNIGGLAVGMAAAILIVAWIHHEWQYDRFHAKTPQLYVGYERATIDGKVLCWEWTPKILGPTLKADYPEIVAVARMMEGSLLYTDREAMFKLQTGFTDPDFFTMFDFPLIYGSRESALTDPYSVILTETSAKRFFGDENPVGRTLRFESHHSVTVAGVIKEFPDNTAFNRLEVIAPAALAKVLPGVWDEHWGNNSIQTYVELHPEASMDAVNSAIRNILTEHLEGNTIELFLYPLARWHLWSNFENGVPLGGRIDQLRILGIIAALILLIACINFTNLSIARSEKRAREAGLRKVFGSSRAALVHQFLAEATATALIAGTAALIIACAVLPLFGTLMGQRFALNLDSWQFWLAAPGFVLLTGVLAGSYPAFFLSAFTPARTLKGGAVTRRKPVSLQKILVVVQFTVACALILSTLIIHRQISYAQQRSAGYNRDRLIYTNLNGDIEKNSQLIKNELVSSGAALSVTKTSAPMTESWSQTWGISWEGKDPNTKQMFDMFFTDGNWAQTTGATIVEGRDINLQAFPTDSTALLLNQTAVKTMNFSTPIGQTVCVNGRDWHVVGVFNDFIIQSPYRNVQPMFIGGPAGWLNVMHIKLNGANQMADNLARATEIFRQYNPQYPFEYKFIDSEYAQKFAGEQQTARLIACFAGLTIFISCLGLFALVAHMAEARRRETGIRKVLGATTGSVVMLLSRRFLTLVLIAVAIATPAAWWVMSRWLATYTWRTDMPWWLFAVTGLGSIVIAFVTVGFQALKAATDNPANAVKTE